MNKFIHSKWTKIYGAIILQAIILFVSISIYSENRRTATEQEQAAIEKVNKVCIGKGGIDDADEEDRSWEVRCENDKTFIISKYKAE